MGKKVGQKVKIICHSSLCHFEYKGTSGQMKIVAKSDGMHLSEVGWAHFGGRRQYK